MKFSHFPSTRKIFLKFPDVPDPFYMYSELRLPGYQSVQRTLLFELMCRIEQSANMIVSTLAEPDNNAMRYPSLIQTIVGICYGDG